MISAVETVSGTFFSPFSKAEALGKVYAGFAPQTISAPILPAFISSVREATSASFPFFK